MRKFILDQPQYLVASVRLTRRLPCPYDPFMPDEIILYRSGVPPFLAPILLTSLLALGGCGSLLSAATADVAGIAGAGIAGAVTESPAAAAGIGLGIAAGANAGLQYVQRNVHRAEQEQIASAAGNLPVGQVGDWSVSHAIPLEDDAHGQVVVTRVMALADVQCREIVFSVDHGKPDKPERDAYVTTICRDGEAWQWALAEPATARWGSLQ
ncbi:MAG: hypothetical protein AB7F35_22175 [Acetobacteraceae bacterium]